MTPPATHGSKDIPVLTCQRPPSTESAGWQTRQLLLGQAVSMLGQESWDALTAALLQITQHAERLAALDEREATHHQQITERLAELVRQLAGTTDMVTGIQATTERQAPIVDSLHGLDQQVALLARRLTDLAPSRGDGADGKDGSYQPAPTARWWKLTGDDRDQALARLRAWVEQIYRPGFGHLAAALGPCWDQHLLCLYGLDWLMELWSLLYLDPDRTAGTIASQAEWQTRLLPALAEQMYLETTRCQHAQQRGDHPGNRP
jgi:hypothetical protein